MRHKGGGHKHHYRVVDFVRNKDGIPRRWSASSTTPTVRRHIALVCYADGERRYIIAPRGLVAGATILSGFRSARSRLGNTLPIRNIPVGSTIHRIELQPGKGGQIARSAGTSAVLMAAKAPTLRCACARVKFARSISNAAPPGEVSNEEHSLRQYGKAGAIRWKGIRPTVRGVAMNPVDHPHGGGEGRTGEGQVPVSPWGTH